MAEGNHFNEPKPKTPDEVMAELLRDIESLRHQLEDTQRERDLYKRLYNSEAGKNDPELTAEDIANAVPAIPLLDAAIKHLDQP
jgi:hypothetical protein